MSTSRSSSVEINKPIRFKVNPMSPARVESVDCTSSVGVGVILIGIATVLFVASMGEFRLLTGCTFVLGLLVVALGLLVTSIQTHTNKMIEIHNRKMENISAHKSRGYPF